MITEFAKAVRIPRQAILGKSRKREISDAREVCYLLLHESGLCYYTVGRICGRTHATVISGIKRVKQLLECGDKEIMRIYEQTKHIKR